MKKNKFLILVIPSLGPHEILVVHVTDNEVRANLLTCIYICRFTILFQIVEFTSVLGKFIRVICVEDFYSAIHNIHGKELLHAGYKETFMMVSNRFFTSLLNFLLIYSKGSSMDHRIPTECCREVHQFVFQLSGEEASSYNYSFAAHNSSRFSFLASVGDDIVSVYTFFLIRVTSLI